MEKDSGRSRIVYDIRDNVGAFIERYIKADNGSHSTDLPSIAAGKNLSLANMAAGMQTIHASFDDVERFASADEFDRFVGYLLNNALFIYVSTEDLDDAFRLFTILNNRGVPLSNSDILKAKNLGAITDDKARGKWAEYWEEVEGEMGRDEFDRFLSLVRTIYVKDKAREGLLKEFDERIYGAKPPLLALGSDTFDAVKAYKDAYDEVILLDGLSVALGNAYRNRINVMRRGVAPHGLDSAGAGLVSQIQGEKAAVPNRAHRQQVLCRLDHSAHAQPAHQQHERRSQGHRSGQDAG